MKTDNIRTDVPSFREFNELVRVLREEQRTVLEMHDRYGVDFTNSSFSEHFRHICEMLYAAWFTKAGRELLEWWVYEDGREMTVDGVRQDLSGVSRLWKFMRAGGGVYFR